VLESRAWRATEFKGWPGLLAQAGHKVLPARAPNTNSKRWCELTIYLTLIANTSQDLQSKERTMHK